MSVPKRFLKWLFNFIVCPTSLFLWSPEAIGIRPRLILSIQPEQAIVMDFQAKYPGPKMLLKPVEMRFSYQDSFAVPSPDAYETLLLDVMKKDPTLFMRADQVEAAWENFMPCWTPGKNQRPVPFQITRPVPGTQGGG